MNVASTIAEVHTLNSKHLALIYKRQSSTEQFEEITLRVIGYVVAVDFPPIMNKHQYVILTIYHHISLLILYQTSS